MRLLAADGPLTRPGFRASGPRRASASLGDQVGLLALPLTAVLTLDLDAAEIRAAELISAARSMAQPSDRW